DPGRGQRNVRVARGGGELSRSLREAHAGTRHDVRRPHGVLYERISSKTDFPDPHLIYVPLRAGHEAGECRRRSRSGLGASRATNADGISVSDERVKVMKRLPSAANAAPGE